ncbi:MAG: ComEC family competence protein [Bacteroidia bacterium]|nr:ComEC family competence protein [Bacteroidia bacterium]
MIDFKNSPFVRILIPFVSGILICVSYNLNVNVFYPLLISLLTVGVLYFGNRKTTSQQSKWLYIFVSDVFLVLAGLHCCYLYDVKNNAEYYGHYVNFESQTWVGEVKDLPVEKEKFYKVQMEVKALQNKQHLSGKVLVYLKKPFDVALLKPGNSLSISSIFNLAKPPLNPHEFNYKEFLERKNIYYQSFIDANEITLLSKPTNFSLLNFGLEIKQKIKTAFESSSLNKEAAQLCIALLTGYDDEINSETINAFAHSGTLHVLSVSGLHTGILYAVLVFLLGVIDKHKQYKILHLIVITLSLWFFVLITGFSPPVLRAVIMLNLIALGRFYYSYSSLHAVNILAVSAFVLLVFNPLLIFDTGFLLSYSAVLGILYFEPVFTALVNSRFSFINKIWQLTSVSLAAQITTLPITLFLFHQFPLWFIFSNLLVIPLCTIVMFLGILLLLKLSFIAPVVNFCTTLIFNCIHLTDAPGIGYIDHIDFGWRDLSFLTAFIIATTFFIKQRTYVYATGATVLLIVWQLSSLVEVIDKKSSSHLSIYQINKQSAVDLKNTQHVYFNANTSASNYSYHIKNNHTFYNYPSIESLNYDFVKSNRFSLLKLSAANQKALISFLKPDYLLVSDNLEVDESYFSAVNLKLVIADGSNKYWNIKKLRSLCDKFAIPFHSTAEKGYLQLDL